MYGSCLPGCLKWWKLLCVLVLAGTFGSPSLPVTNSKTPEKSFISLTKWQVQPLCHRWCEDIMRWSNFSGRNSCTPVSRYLVICGAWGIKGTLSRVFSLSKCVAPACAALIWSRLLINFGIGSEDKKGEMGMYTPETHTCLSLIPVKETSGLLFTKISMHSRIIWNGSKRRPTITLCPETMIHWVWARSRHLNFDNCFQVNRIWAVSWLSKII